MWWLPSSGTWAPGLSVKDMVDDSRSSELPIILEDVLVGAGDVPILRGVSLTFAAGPPTVLIGPNGSGKTTLLRAAMGLLKPDAGRVTWGGRSETDPARRAFVFQRPVMLRRSALGNVLYALATAGVAKPRRH